jgi:hypothetical protein
MSLHSLIANRVSHFNPIRTALTAVLEDRLSRNSGLYLFSFSTTVVLELWLWLLALFDLVRGCLSAFAFCSLVAASRVNLTSILTVGCTFSSSLFFIVSCLLNGWIRRRNSSVNTSNVLSIPDFCCNDLTILCNGICVCPMISFSDASRNSIGWNVCK